MIQSLQNIPPIIDLGFGIQQTQIATNQQATVWLGTLYNQKEYVFTLTAPGAVITKISNYQYRIAYMQPGSYTVNLTVNALNKKLSLASNTLNITVV